MIYLSPKSSRLSEEQWCTVVRMLANPNIAQSDIAAKVGCSQKTVCNILWEVFPKSFVRHRKQIARHNIHQARKKRGDFCTRRYSKGYLLILAPKWYANKQEREFIPAHDAIVCRRLGLSCMPKGYIVHHKNQNKLDNRYSNLMLMTISDHMYYHRTGKYRV